MTVTDLKRKELESKMRRLEMKAARAERLIKRLDAMVSGDKQKENENETVPSNRN